MTGTDENHGGLTALEQEAHGWIRRLVSGEATEADAAALRRWCGLSPAHAAAFAAASQFWQAFGPAGSSLPDEAAIAGARQVAGHGPIGPRGRIEGRMGGRMGRRAAIGGAVAAAASAAAFMVLRPPLGLWPSFSELSADYRTGIGEQRRIALADGVAVQMNSRTSLSIGREPGLVELIAGEASFTAPDRPSRPFTVLAAGGRTSALEARFDVRVMTQSVSVTCLATEVGAAEVRVTHGGREVALGSRQRVSYGASGLGAVVAVDPAVASAWQQGLMIFEMTPLAEVIDELNRYRPGRILLLNAELGRSPVNGRFRIDRPDEALLQIERAFGVHASTLPGGFVLLS